MILCNFITLNHNQQHQLSEVAFKTLHDRILYKLFAQVHDKLFLEKIVIIFSSSFSFSIT
jgi:hypothetical protein